MKKTSLSSNLFSHPKKLLEDHLIGVSSLTALFLNEKPAIIKKQFAELSRIIALSHDIGKATSYFQKYLNADESEKNKLKSKRETHHSLFSAVCAYYLSKEINPDSLLPFFAFLTVRRHHGPLRDVVDDVIFDDGDATLLRQQLESIEGKSFDILARKLLEAGTSVLLSKAVIARWFDDFIGESKQLKRELRKLNGTVSDYIMLNLLYSLLLDSDKSDVVVREAAIFERKELKSEDWVDNYKAKTLFPASPLNSIREKAYCEAIAHKIDLNDRLLSLNLPTGLGKTLTALSYALKLKEEIRTKADVSPRIVYALPFLSIIDQNAQVFESVIRTNDIETDTNILLKHHHLSEVFYKKEDNEFELDEAKILIEGWNAEIIVTTFVQFFHTLISNKNKSLRKFHRLANSIIILDEVQSIPVKYWSLLRDVLIEISERLNTYVILSTATEPLIFGDGEMKSLVNRDIYFALLDRVSMIPILDKAMTLKELGDYFDVSDGKTYLFIFNTINTAKDFYKLINDKGLSLTYLSTHLTPKDRLKRIMEIKEGKYKVVVSTQLVEAEVDIDFDVVVRDIAPLDSINQSAGRCNRNDTQKGEVYIVSLQDERGKQHASYVYDAVLLDITRKILSSCNEIKEKDFLELIEKYYKETEIKKSQATSRGLLEAITRLRYDSVDDKISISDFQLIEEDYPKNDVFIEQDKKAGEIWEEFIRLKDVSDLFERKKAFDSFKAEFYQYIVSVPAHVKNIPPTVGEIGCVEQSALGDYYDEETGFITKDTRAVVIW